MKIRKKRVVLKIHQELAEDREHFTGVVLRKKKRIRTAVDQIGCGDCGRTFQKGLRGAEEIFISLGLGVKEQFGSFDAIGRQIGAAGDKHLCNGSCKGCKAGDQGGSRGKQGKTFNKSQEKHILSGLIVAREGKRVQQEAKKDEKGADLGRTAAAGVS